MERVAVAGKADQARISAAVRELLLAIGDDPDRPGLRDTPKRVAELYAELFSGLTTDPLAELSEELEENHSGLVLVRDIPFHSMCEHHLLPFSGIAQIAYLPGGRLVGLGRIVRVVRTCARRPQLQERLTAQIADVLAEGLRPLGVAVVVEATHLCMTMRGEHSEGTTVVTTATRGLYATSADAWAEVRSLLRRDY